MYAGVIAHMERLDCVRSMEWWTYEVEPDVACRVLSSPRLTNLRTLVLAGCRLTDAAVLALANNAALRNLTTLNLGSDHGSEVSGNDFGDVGVAALASSPHLANVEVLDLEDATNVGIEGVRALLASPHFPHLRSLNLRATNLNDDGVAELARSPFLARLRELYIGPWYYQDDPPGGPAALALATSPHLENVERLVLGRRMELSESAVAALHARFGDRVVIE
jgi:hypothetical protein